MLPPSKPGAPKNLADAPTPKVSVPLGVRLPKGTFMQNAKTNNRNFGYMHSISSSHSWHRRPPFPPIPAQAAPSLPKIFINANVAGWALTARLSANSLRYGSFFVADHHQEQARGPALPANAFAREQQAAIPVARAAIAANKHAMARMLKRHLKTHGTSINSPRTASFQSRGAAA